MTVDPTAPTQPTTPRRVSWAKPPRKKKSWRGLLIALLVLFSICLLLVAIVTNVPGRTNVLILGIDTREAGSNLGRSDTIILTTFVPSQPYIGLLSIPRDLWVTIPGVGENRINTAHFFAEADQPGSGPEAAMETVRQNFGVDVDYYMRVRFDGLTQVVDTLGGVEINLPRAMSGYSEGVHQLNGTEALAFVRDRAGSDDFFRMERGQIFMVALWKRLLDSEVWPQLPDVIPQLLEMVDSDIPLRLYPKLGLALLRVGPENLDSHSITRELVNPFTTAGGAQVLGPNWDLINPLLQEIFEQ